MGCGNAAHRSAALAAGARPVPFRTRKLSRPAPMVLRGKPVGEQGAADRWTAFPHAGAGAPPLFALTGRLRPTGMLSIGRFSVITPALLPIRARTQLLRSSSQAVRAPRLWFRAVSIPLLRFPSAWYELALWTFYLSFSRSSFLADVSVCRLLFGCFFHEFCLDAMSSTGLFRQFRYLFRLTSLKDTGCRGARRRDSLAGPFLPLYDQG